MGQFTSLLNDPFLGERSANAPQARATGYADEEALAYAAKRKGRNPSEQDAYAAMARKAPPRATFERRWSVWGAGYGGTQSTDGNAVDGTANTSSRVYGGAAGFDYRLTPQTLVGFALGGAGTNYSLANGLGSGSSELFQAGIYGRHDFGAAYLAGSLAYGWQDVTTDRNVFFNRYRANFDTDAFTGRLETGYRFALGASGLTPYGAGQFTTIWLPDYAEQVVAGTNLFALSYQSKDVTASRAELGLRGDTSFAMQEAIVTLRGRAAWAHAFNTDRSVSTFFQTLPASTFVVNGAAPARDAALVSASVESRWLNGFSVAASFEGEFSHVTESYASKGIVRYQW
jgi:outer membrane autotransporter protein